MQQGQVSSVMLISAAGWIVSVAAVALALFVGKPAYYARAYHGARQTQAEANIKAVDEVLSARQIEGKDYAVLGSVRSTSSNAIEIETKNPYLNNPLRSGPHIQMVTVSAQTVVEKQTMLPQDEFMKALQEGQRKGLTTDKIQLYTTDPLSLADLKPGDDVRILPINIQDVLKDQFEAKQIVLVISSQSQPTN